MSQTTVGRGDPRGFWSTPGMLSKRQVDQARVTLKIATAAEPRRARVLAGGVWWTWRPVDGR